MGQHAVPATGAVGPARSPSLEGRPDVWRGLLGDLCWGRERGGRLCLGIEGVFELGKGRELGFRVPACVFGARRRGGGVARRSGCSGREGLRHRGFVGRRCGLRFGDGSVCPSGPGRGRPGCLAASAGGGGAVAVAVGVADGALCLWEVVEQQGVPTRAVVHPCEGPVVLSLWEGQRRAFARQ